LAFKIAVYEIMNPNVVIRNETPDDADSIIEVTIAAFEAVTISDGTPNWYGLGPVSVSVRLAGTAV
jgi:predicted N-acetyltransferase YhbS